MGKYYFFALLLSLSIFTSCVMDPLGSGVKLSGTVYSTEGPLEGVEVVFHLLDEKIVTYTDTDGLYSMSLSEGGGAVYISYNKDGFSPAGISFAFTDNMQVIPDMWLRTLEEAAYIIPELDFYEVGLYGEIFSINIDANVIFESFTEENWIQINKVTDRLITVNCKPNNLYTDRMGIISLKGDFGAEAEIILLQKDGRRLELVNYIGLYGDSFIDTIPYISFNREIELIKITSDKYTTIGEAVYSEDRKSVFFPDAKTAVTDLLTVSYEVQSDNKDRYEGTFNLYLFESVSYDFNYEFIFTDCSDSFWMRKGEVIAQYDINELKEISRIYISDAVLSEPSYNPNNNCFYVLRHEYYGWKYDIYNIVTGNKVGEFNYSEVSDYQFRASELVFAGNGIGLFVVNEKLYMLDSTDGHTIKQFADFGGTTVRKTGISNHGQTFWVITDMGVYVFDWWESDMRFYDLPTELYASDYWASGLLVWTQYGETAGYIDFQKKSLVKVDFHEGGNAVFIITGEEPCILTSDLLFFDIKNGKGRTHAVNGGKIFITPDRKSFFLNNGNTYQFQTKIITDFYYKTFTN